MHNSNLTCITSCTTVYLYGKRTGPQACVGKWAYEIAEAKSAGPCFQAEEEMSLAGPGKREGMELSTAKYAARQAQFLQMGFARLQLSAKSG